MNSKERHDLMAEFTKCQISYKNELEELGWECRIEYNIVRGRSWVKVIATKPFPDEPWHGYFHRIEVDTSHPLDTIEGKNFVDSLWKSIFELVMQDQKNR